MSVIIKHKSIDLVNTTNIHWKTIQKCHKNKLKAHVSLVTDLKGQASQLRSTITQLLIAMKQIMMRAIDSFPVQGIATESALAHSIHRIERKKKDAKYLRPIFHDISKVFKRQQQQFDNVIEKQDRETSQPTDIPMEFKTDPNQQQHCLTKQPSGLHLGDQKFNDSQTDQSKQALSELEKQTQILKQCLKRICSHNQLQYDLALQAPSLEQKNNYQQQQFSQIQEEDTNSNQLQLQTIIEVTQQSFQTEYSQILWDQSLSHQNLLHDSQTIPNAQQTHHQALRIFKSLNYRGNKDDSVRVRGDILLQTPETFKESNSQMLSAGIIHLSSSGRTQEQQSKTKWIYDEQELCRKEVPIQDSCLYQISYRENFNQNMSDIFSKYPVKFYPPYTLGLQIVTDISSPKIFIYQGKMKPIQCQQLKKDSDIHNNIGMKPHGFGTLYELLKGQYSDPGISRNTKKVIVYSGQWKNGFFQGWGKLYQNYIHSINHTSYHGMFFRGRPHGPGTIFYSSETSPYKKFIGNFYHGSIQGEGTLFYQSGKNITGLWDSHRLITEDKEQIQQHDIQKGTKLQSFSECLCHKTKCHATSLIGEG